MSALLNSPASKHTARNIWLWLLLPFAALLLMTVLFTVYDLDRSISGNFYRPGEGWFLAKQPLWYWLHKKGTIPGIVLAVGCLLVWLLSVYMPRLKDWRKPCLVVVLTAVLAAGLLVNAILKQYWGRPRPSQTIEYGGQWEYRSIFPPGTPGKGASFPCGHCTMGFVFLATAAFHRRSKVLAVAGVSTGIVLGTLLSAARVVQGAHFTSDTIWSFGLVGMTVAGLMIWLPEAKEASLGEEKKPQSKRRRAWLTIGTIVAILLMAGGFLTRRPFYNTRSYPLTLPVAAQQLNVQIDRDPERLTIDYVDQGPATLQVDAHGFGWIKFKYRQELAQRSAANSLETKLTIVADSYFAELDHALTLTLPVAARERVVVLLNGKPVTH